MDDTLPVCYLTTTGRRTGSPHRVEIWFLPLDGDIYVFSGNGERTDWLQNLRAEPRALLELPDMEPAWFRWDSAGRRDETPVRRHMDARYHGTDEGEPLTSWATNSLVVRLVPAKT